jgi:predicted RNase H-like HicB family nuclease
MPQAECGIIVERLRENCYRATCLSFPDCQAVAANEEEARRAVEEAIAGLLRDREQSGCAIKSQSP